MCLFQQPFKIIKAIFQTQLQVVCNNSILALVSVAICLLSIAPFFQVLAICRFGLGVLSSQYLALAINLIKDHIPQHQWKPYGALFSAMRIFGILTCYVLGKLFQKVTTSAGNIAIFLGPACIAVIQAICLACRLPESPVELLRAKQEGKAAKALQYLYAGSIEKKMNQLQLRIDKIVPEKEDSIRNPLNMCGLHTALLRQFCGLTYLVVYSSQIPLTNQTSLGNVASVVQNIIQLMGGFFGIAVITRISRYYMVTIGTYTALLFNIVLGILSFLELPVLSYVTVCLFMFVESMILTSVAWFYPAELCTPKIQRYAGLTSMAGATIVTVVPPFVAQQLSDNQSYPMFFFFAFYLVFAIILNARLQPRGHKPHQKSDQKSIEIELTAYKS